MKNVMKNHTHKANILKIFIPMLAIMILPGHAKANYTGSCAGCHGSLASSDKTGSSATKIKSAITSNRGGMGSLSGLTNAQLNAIALELGGTANLSVSTLPKPPITNPPVKPPTTKPPTTISCDLPKKLIKGVCVLTPTSCNDAANEYEREHKNDVTGGDNDDDSHDDDDDKKVKLGANKLTISALAKQSIHAEQLLNLGIAAYGDDRKIAIGANLPKGARFTDAYNAILQMQQGTIKWKVPGNLAGKTIKIKFCAKTHNGKGYGKKQNARFVSRDVLVKVLPKLKPVAAAKSVVVHTITHATYSTGMSKLSLSGQVKWSVKSTLAERNAAIAQPIQLTDANTAALLGTANVKANGSWSVSIIVPSAVVPNAIDATFQDAVATKPVTRLP